MSGPRSGPWDSGPSPSPSNAWHWLCWWRKLTIPDSRSPRFGRRIRTAKQPRSTAPRTWFASNRPSPAPARQRPCRSTGRTLFSVGSCADLTAEHCDCPVVVVDLCLQVGIAPVDDVGYGHDAPLVCHRTQIVCGPVMLGCRETVFGVVQPVLQQLRVRHEVDLLGMCGVVPVVELLVRGPTR